MSGKNGVSQVIKTFVAVMALIALTIGFGVIKATLDDVFGFARGALYTVWPTQVADSLITLGIIDEILDVDWHAWTPVRDGGMGWRQYTPSSNSTTLESNKSVRRLEHLGVIESSQALNRSRWDKTKWYTIDYGRLAELVPQTAAVEGPVNDAPVEPPSMAGQASTDEAASVTMVVS